MEPDRAFGPARPGVGEREEGAAIEGRGGQPAVEFFDELGVGSGALVLAGPQL